MQWLGARLGALLVPSVADLLFIGCLLVAVAAGSKMVSADGDPARHLTVGESILAAGAIPHVDQFSHTMAGAPFVPYEWLAEVASAASYRLAGLAGPVLLHSTAIALTFGIGYATLRRAGHPLLLCLVVTLLAIITSMLHWLARPHIFTMLGAALFVAILEGWQRSAARPRWRLWTLPALLVLWANLHGGFLVGYVILGTYIAADVTRWLCLDGERHQAAAARLRQMALPALLALAAPVINPAGVALFGHVTGYFGKQLLVDRTQEYMAPSLHDPTVRPFFALLGLTAGALVFSRRRPALHHALAGAVFGAFALYSARNIPLFAIVVAPALAAALAGLSVDNAVGARPRRVLAAISAWLARRNSVYEREERRVKGHLWPMVLLAGLLATAVQHRAASPLGITFDPATQPVAAVAYLKAHPPVGNGFNDMSWGGYLLHELWPTQRVFIDGQTDFYGEPLAREYLDVLSLNPGYQQILDRYNIQWVLTQSNTPLADQLASSGGWQVTYRDSLATLLVRA